MENFSGILFATVNKIQFDEAFFRRFMYKIEMTQPNAETRLQIILHLFPDMCKEFASYIANKYNLTGANISNIIKKYILISKSKDSKQIEDYIDELCREELFMQTNRVVINDFQISKN